MTIEVYTATQAQRDKYEGHTESDATAERTLQFANYSGKWCISTATPEHFPSIAAKLRKLKLETLTIQNEEE